ncbi:hypothetical protein QFZ79_003395 [Arthrobacter sp. V4I6]|jgi:hypothetical protein|uniref:hypothetical protein n=1 Tax=unclassified Arthrobacter TaxID=235627 RepID=UPI00277F68F7|nr:MULTISPECIES: hypothetical protein [unclassified Arthrobacter]MDQ0821023.1 hypothetical protein [Arthrobacter sp. V1I7]MDQ0855284.1 hypothetical protein [Arthrobacter sp. V4I6]
MADSTSTPIQGVPALEDVMAALAKQSIFDLPTLARKIVETSQEHAEDEDEQSVTDLFVHETYVLYHSKDQ